MANVRACMNLAEPPSLAKLRDSSRVLSATILGLLMV
jgi:hypothetical protein